YIENKLNWDCPRQYIPRCRRCPALPLGGDGIPLQRSFQIALFEKFILALTQVPEESFAIDRRNSAIFDVVVASVNPFAYLNNFLQIASHRIFEKLIRRTSSLGGKFGKT